MTPDKARKEGTTRDPWAESRPIRTVQELWARAEEDPWLAKNLADEPVKTLAAVFHPPLESDVWIYRGVVAALGFTVLIATFGAIYLAARSVDVPEVIVALGSAAVGALAGLLAPSPASKSA
jgi:hypothetical protein